MTDTLFEFPCAFPVKIMGVATDEFTDQISAIVRRHAPDFTDTAMTTRTSGGGKYMALTCTIRATSRSQLDALYRELTAHSLVKVVL